MAYAQTDLKRLVAYTSVSHMGFVLLGIFAWNTLALQGVVLQIVCHALSTGALFILVGGLQDRIHTRDMDKMGGLWQVAPRMGGTAMFFAMASLGLPGLGNFVAEFLILVGDVAGEPVGGGARRRRPRVRHRVRAVDDAARLPGRGDARLRASPTSASARSACSPRMIAALVLLGFCPQPLITTARQTVTGVQAQITARQAALDPADRRRRRRGRGRQRRRRGCRRRRSPTTEGGQ